MNSDRNDSLKFYQLSSDWKIHLIDAKTNQENLQLIKRFIENGQVVAFDSETTPSFYLTPAGSPNRPSLLQAAIRSADKKEKNVVLFDLQGAANCSMFELIEHLFNKQSMLKLSHAFPNDLAQLKVFLDENCFQKSKIERVVELSDVFRQTFAEEKNENLFSLKRMAELTLQRKLNKKQQCANWSKRPLQQAMKDYAAIDVVVMIEIFDRFSQQIDDLSSGGSRDLKFNDRSFDVEKTMSSRQFSRLKMYFSAVPEDVVVVEENEKFERRIDVEEIPIYRCCCSQRFLSQKTREKHVRNCEKTRSERDFSPRGRGYLPPALKRLHQKSSISERVRNSTNFVQWKKINDSRPPDAEFFLADDDSEIAQAFGFQTRDTQRNPKETRSDQRSTKQMKIAAFPPKIDFRSVENSDFNFSNEETLIDRLKSDLDTQTEFHRHSFGLGGRGKIGAQAKSPPSPRIE